MGTYLMQNSPELLFNITLIEFLFIDVVSKQKSQLQVGNDGLWVGGICASFAKTFILAITV